MKIEKHLINNKKQHLVTQIQDAETFYYRFCAITYLISEHILQARHRWLSRHWQTLAVSPRQVHA